MAFGLSRSRNRYATLFAGLVVVLMIAIATLATTARANTYGARLSGEHLDH